MSKGKQKPEGEPLSNARPFREEAIGDIYFALVPAFEGMKVIRAGKLTPVRMPSSDKIKFSCSFLKGGLRRGVMASETHFPKVNGESHYELLIDIGIDDHLEVAKNVAHQMLHIGSGDEGHRAAFKELAQRMNFNTDVHGLRGAVPDDEMVKDVILPFLATTDGYPHKALNYSALRKGDKADEEHGGADVAKPSKGRLRSSHCPQDGCGYIVQVSREAVKTHGEPWCPRHKAAMAVKWKPEDDDFVLSLEAAAKARAEAAPPTETPPADQQDNALVEHVDAAE